MRFDGEWEYGRISDTTSKRATRNLNNYNYNPLVNIIIMQNYTCQCYQSIKSYGITKVLCRIWLEPKELSKITIHNMNVYTFTICLS